MTETPPTNAQSVTATNQDPEIDDVVDPFSGPVTRNTFVTHIYLLTLAKGWAEHTDIPMCDATKLCLLPVDHLGDHFPRSIEFPHEP